MDVLVAALTWDPQIRGALILLAAVLILPGSVYLLLATNLGAKVGFLIAMAALTGWIGVMSVVWMVYGIGMRGRDPNWKTLEVVTGDARLADSTVEAAEGFPGGWTRLRPGDATLGDAQATVDKVLVKPTGPVLDVHGEPVEAEPSEFPPMFDAPEDYVQVAGYRRGGDNELFAIGSHKFFFRRSARHVVVQVQPSLRRDADPQKPFGPGGPPALPQADPTQPVTSVVMVRDSGSIRFPPFVLALSSLTLFGVICNVLHRRDKEILRLRAAGQPAGAPA